MKTPVLHHTLLTAGLLLFPLMQCMAQRPSPFNPDKLNPDNPARIVFQLTTWNVHVPDRTKLIDIGNVVDDRHTSVLFLIGGADHNDYRRQLLVTHWDGFQFATDSTLSFLGWAVDPLLIGRFRVAPPTSATPGNPGAAPTNTAKGKHPPSPPTHQVAVAGGLYTVTGGTFVNIASAPPALKLALDVTDGPTRMVSGYGESAAFYELGDKDVRTSNYLLNADDDGFPHWGIGTQYFDGLKEYQSGIRYAQTYWVGRHHWQICLVKGKPLDMKDNPDATTEDKLVVYVPKFDNRNKTCWQLTRPEDYEETWRSGPIPGRVLDVRVGDATSTGQVGILVLTSENKDQARHLYYYLPVIPGSKR